MKEVNTILEMLIESRTQLLEAKVRIKEREAEINKDLSDCYIAIAALTPKVEVAAEQQQEQSERVPKIGDELVAIKNVHNDNGDIVIQPGKTYPVNRAIPGAISVVDDRLQVQFFFTGDGYSWHWKSYFRFADEQTERLPKVGDELVAICETDEFLTKGKTYPVIELWIFRNVQKFDIIDDRGSAHSFTHEKWRDYFRFADEPTSEDLENLHSYLHVNSEPKKPYRIKTRQEMIDGGAVLCSEYKGHKHCIKHPDGMHLFTNEMTVLFGSETETNEPHDIIIDGIPYAIEPWMITENK